MKSRILEKTKKVDGYTLFAMAMGANLSYDQILKEREIMKKNGKGSKRYTIKKTTRNKPVNVNG